jgi:hypothetical protein
MRARLDSEFTLVYKWAFPLLWIPAFGFVALSVAFGGMDVDGAPAEPIHKLGFPVVWVVASALILWFTRRLRTVYLHANRLTIGDGRREENVPLCSVIHVSETWFVDPKQIIIRYSRPNGIEARAYYITEFALRWPFSPHPDVRYLRERVEAARRHAAPSQWSRRTSDRNR